MKPDKAVLMACPWVARKCQGEKCLAWNRDAEYCQILANYHPFMHLNRQDIKESKDGETQNV